MPTASPHWQVNPDPPGRAGAPRRGPVVFPDLADDTLARQLAVALGLLLRAAQLVGLLIVLALLRRR